MSELTHVFRKETAEPRGAEKDLALHCAAELFSEPLHAYQADFLKGPGCLCVSRTKGIQLCYFFKSPDAFMHQVGLILHDYANARKQRHVILSKYSHHGTASELEICVIVFTPVYQEIWSDVSALIRIPMQIVPFMTVGSRGKQAIILEMDKSIGMGEKPSRGRDEAGPERFETSEIEVQKQQKLETVPQETFHETDISLEKEKEYARSKRSSLVSSENYFQRAKLNSDEIRALLDLEFLLEDLRSGSTRVSI